MSERHTAVNISKWTKEALIDIGLEVKKLPLRRFICLVRGVQ